MADNNIKRFKIKVVKNPKLELWRTAKVVYQGDRFADATIIARKIKPCVRKLDKHRYVLLRDCSRGIRGEIFMYAEKKDNSRHYQNLRRTFNHIRWLIRTNFDGESENQLFVTLTYAENMTDKDRLYEDFKGFIKALKYELKDHKLDYITVAEPQGRGAWHMHLMLKSNKPLFKRLKNGYVSYILKNRTIAAKWKQGFTQTKPLKSDDVGTYFVTYFTDIVYNDDGKEATVQEIASMSDAKISKRKIKGERLAQYPKYFKFYRCSRGIKRPGVDAETLEDVVQEYGKPVYSAQYEYVQMDDDEVDNVANVVTKHFFKKEVNKENDTG
jgi:hypothetical protein